MATITLFDAEGNPVEVELPPTPGRKAADDSRPVVLSNEDLLALRRVWTLGSSIDLAFTSTSARSAALTGDVIRLVAKGADCRVLIGSNPTALATSVLLMEGIEYLFAITSGHKVAAIRDDSVNGVLNITTMS